MEVAKPGTHTRQRSALRRTSASALAAAACAATAIGCGGGGTHHRATPAQRNAEARAQLVRAARDMQAYYRKHQTYDVGGGPGLHKLDPATSLVDFVDGRQTSFFLAVDPPTTTTKWGYNYDHKRVSRACGPGGTGCPPNRHW